MVSELCSHTFQRHELKRFILCWSQPSAVHAQILDAGTRLYTFEPKANRKEWNERFRNWTATAWRSFIQHHHHQRPGDSLAATCLAEYSDLMARALADSKWLGQVADFHMEDTQWRG